MDRIAYFEFLYGSAGGIVIDGGEVGRFETETYVVPPPFGYGPEAAERRVKHLFIEFKPFAKYVELRSRDGGYVLSIEPTTSGKYAVVFDPNTLGTDMPCPDTPEMTEEELHHGLSVLAETEEWGVHAVSRWARFCRLQSIRDMQCILPHCVDRYGLLQKWQTDQKRLVCRQIGAMPNLIVHHVDDETGVHTEELLRLPYDAEDWNDEVSDFYVSPKGYQFVTLCEDKQRKVFDFITPEEADDAERIRAHFDRPSFLCEDRDATLRCYADIFGLK